MMMIIIVISGMHVQTGRQADRQTSEVNGKQTPSRIPGSPNRPASSNHHNYHHTKNVNSTAIALKKNLLTEVE